MPEMACVTTFLSCFLVATVASASHASDFPFSIRSERRPEFVETVGPALPADTLYAGVMVSTYHLALSIVNVSRRTAGSHGACYALATSRGANVFEYDESERKCNLGSLQFPICESRQGELAVFIQPKFLSNGTTDDGVNVELLNKGVLLWRVLNEPEREYGTFRVENPTILEFPELLDTPSSGPKQVIFTDEDEGMLEIDAAAMVDPACYTTSSCGVPFLYPVREAGSVPQVLSDFCGKTIWVGANETLNFVSHEHMGCVNFPDVGYNRTGCRINYRGSTPITFKINYFNFVGDDECDGFYLSVLAFYDPSNWNVTLLCKNPLTEISSPNPRGRIDFGKTAITGRPKYGFLITIVSEP